MAVRVIVLQGLMPEWLELFGSLHSSDGWTPIYWVMEEKFRDPVRARFPEVIFHDNLAAIRGIPAPEMSDLVLFPVDQAVLEELSFHQTIALWMMDRMDPGHCFSLAERMRHWRRLLAYWGGVLRRLKPDLVVFPESPHAIYDYAIYALCAQLGVRMVHFHKAPPLRLVFPLERFESEYPQVAKAYAQALERPTREGMELSVDAQRELARINSPAQAPEPYWMQWQTDRARSQPPWWRRWLGMARHPERLVNSVRRGIAFLTDPAPANYLKLRDQDLERSYIGGLAWRRHRAQAQRRNQALRRYYESRCRPPDLSRPFIFVPLHYQPEKTTSPDGGVFVDQYLMVEMLSRSLPQGWRILVKEHGSHFLFFYRGCYSRSPVFYDDLASLPQVELLPVSTPAATLISAAQAVAVVTGTAGWEAVVLGKPALIFGHPWYKGCEGAFHVQTMDALSDAIEKIRMGYRPDPERLWRYVWALEHVGTRAYLEHIARDVMGISREENTRRLASALRGFLAGEG